MTTAVRPYHRPSFKLFLAALGVILLLLGAFVFRFILLAALIGIGVGILLSPLIHRVKLHTRLPHGLSVLVVVLALASILAAAGYAFGSSLAGQIDRLLEQGPGIGDSLTEWLDRLRQKFPWIRPILDGFNSGNTLERVGLAFFQGLKVSASGLASALLVFIIGVFTAANADSYFRGFLLLFPPDVRPRLAELGHSSAGVVRRWFSGQLIVLSISGTLTALALWIIGIDYWLLLGVLTVVLDFIPFIGAIITAAFACALTLGTEPDKIWWVLLTFLAIQQIESDITLPIVMKERIRMPEAHLLIFTLMMGFTFGVVGVFVAPPLFAVLHHILMSTYVPWIAGRPPRSPSRSMSASRRHPAS
jgi:predicted PurR-regulated permease PerM